MKKIKQFKNLLFFSSGRADLGILIKIANSIKIKNLEINFIVILNNNDNFFEIKKLFKKKNYRLFFIKGNKQISNNTDIIFNFTKTLEYLSKKIKKLKPEFLIVLGDRYEALAAATSSNLSGLPIIHFHGGEITENSYDDYFRHSITKLSSYHFVSHSTYKKRVIQMGENPKNVF